MGDYYPNTVTDELLKELEKRIAKEYGEASKECKRDASLYFSKFAQRYEKEYEAYEQGKYTKQEFTNWVYTQVARGQGWEKLSEDLANRCCNANRVAISYINDSTPTIWTLNRNFEAYAIDQAYGNSLNFHAYDERTVRTLIANDEIKLPAIKRYNYDRDFLWNKKKMNSALISNILQGKDLNQLSNSFLPLVNMNEASAIRNARTTFTGAQNAGRMASYVEAVEMGIELQKEWISTLDDRTRSSHQELDGERVDYNEYFSNDLQYPGDPRGEACEVYNCRCTMRAIIPNVNESRDVERRGRDSESWIDEDGRIQKGYNIKFNGTTYTGKNGTISYKEWLANNKMQEPKEEPSKEAKEEAKETAEEVKAITGADILALEDMQAISNTDNSEREMLDNIEKALEKNADEIVKEALTFKEAKTKGEAETFALKFANSVNYKNVSLNNANIINKTLDNLTTKYPINKLECIENNKTKGAVAKANYHHLILGNNLNYNDGMEKFFAEQEYNREIIAELKERYAGRNMPYAIENSISKLEETLKFSRFGVCESDSDRYLEGVITHEYGHIIADQYIGQINKEQAVKDYNLNYTYRYANENWGKVYDKAKDSGDIYNISKYASKNSHEFFAECFCAREMGEDIPEYISQGIDEVLKYGTM